MKKLFAITLALLLLLSLLVACADDHTEPIDSDSVVASDSEAGTTAQPSESESEEASQTQRPQRPSRETTGEEETTDTGSDSSDQTTPGQTPPEQTTPPVESQEEEDEYNGDGVKLPELNLWN